MIINKSLKVYLFLKVWNSLETMFLVSFLSLDYLIYIEYQGDSSIKRLSIQDPYTFKKDQDYYSDVYISRVQIEDHSLVCGVEIWKYCMGPKH